MDKGEDYKWDTLLHGKVSLPTVTPSPNSHHHTLTNLPSLHTHTLTQLPSSHPHQPHHSPPHSKPEGQQQWLHPELSRVYRGMESEYDMPCYPNLAYPAALKLRLLQKKTQRESGTNSTPVAIPHVPIHPCFHVPIPKWLLESGTDSTLVSIPYSHTSILHSPMSPCPHSKISHSHVCKLHNCLISIPHVSIPPVHLLETRIAMQTFEEDHIYNIYNSRKALTSHDMIMLCLGLFEQGERRLPARSEPLYINSAVELTAAWIRDIYDM